MSKKIWVLITLVATIGCVMFLSGCTTEPPTSTITGAGTLQLLLTDDNADLDILFANITISEVKVHNASTGEDNDSEAGWYTIVNESQTFDLIALNNVSTLLGEKNLTAGKYTQIRLFVNSAIIVINNSSVIEEHILDVPSDTIKLTHNFDIVDNETTTLTLDFDIQESVIVTGNNQYRFQPTIRVVQE